MRGHKSLWRDRKQQKNGWGWDIQIFIMLSLSYSFMPSESFYDAQEKNLGYLSQESYDHKN